MIISDNEFIKHEGILAVDPGYSFSSGAGWAFFELGRLKYCGLIRPFAPGCTSEQCIFEVLNKFSRQWEELKGFSMRPLILCLETPVNYSSYSRPMNTGPLGEIQFLNGMLTERFKPQKILRPTPQLWKGNKSKENHHPEIIAKLDAYEKKVLSRDLLNIPGAKQHNVIDAIGLGLYALPFEEKLNLENKIKKTRSIKMQA